MTHIKPNLKYLYFKLFDKLRIAPDKLKIKYILQRKRGIGIIFICMEE